jgi:hypothetical protein
MAAVFSLVAGKAVAQIRAALIKNVDEPGRLPYVHQVDVFPCNFQCQADFPAVPAGKRLVVEHVSALIVMNPGTPPIPFLWLDENTASSSNFIRAVVQGNFSVSVRSDNLNFLTLNRDVRTYYESGTTPRLNVFDMPPNGLSQSFVLTGYLIDATN